MSRSPKKLSLQEIEQQLMTLYENEDVESADVVVITSDTD